MHVLIGILKYFYNRHLYNYMHIVIIIFFFSFSSTFTYYTFWFYILILLLFFSTNIAYLLVTSPFTSGENNNRHCACYSILFVYYVFSCTHENVCLGEVNQCNILYWVFRGMKEALLIFSIRGYLACQSQYIRSNIWFMQSFY